MITFCFALVLILSFTAANAMPNQPLAEFEEISVTDENNLEFSVDDTAPEIPKCKQEDSYEPNDSRTHAHMVKPETEIHAALCAGDQDWLRMKLEPGLYEVQFKADQSSSRLSMYAPRSRKARVQLRPSEKWQQIRIRKSGRHVFSIVQKNKKAAETFYSIQIRPVTSRKSKDNFKLHQQTSQQAKSQNRASFPQKAVH